MNQDVERKRGRPRKPFDQLSENMKRQNAKKMRTDLSTEELGYALEKCFKAAGYLEASKIVKQLVDDPQSGHDYQKSYENQNISKKYTTNEALALSVDMKLSKRQYDLMRFGAKKRNACIYPTYGRVLAAKKRCYPTEAHISEIGFKIDLQSILDLTTKRLFETFTSRQFVLPMQKLRLISKWGFDGASGQSKYKQKYQDPNADDSSIFIVTLVPIILRDANNPEIIHWQNPKPSSTTYCRPVRLEFHKETEVYTLKVNDEINQEIDALRPTIIEDEDYSMEITHELHCTMVDGKICNHLSHNKSTMCCFICNASPIDMNVLNRIYDRPKNTEFYRFGLSTLHAWIRFMECVLHISYNLSFKKWAARKQKHKDEQQKNRELIQQKFKRTTGLKIDYVLQGKGNSNDGNTARRFFRDYETTATITGFNVQLLKQFAVILQTMASGKEINVEAFSLYTKETAKLYVKHYDWYYMPITVHKILVHGSDVIQHAVVPIGQLSEEVQESRHKEVRRYRECNSRKVSRIKTNEDMMHALLISSDPVITSSRIIPNTKKLDMFPEAEDLLINTHLDSDQE